MSLCYVLSFSAYTSLSLGISYFLCIVNGRVFLKNFILQLFIAGYLKLIDYLHSFIEI